MPALPSPTWKVTFRGALHGNETQNVRYYGWIEGDLPTPLQIAQNLATEWGLEMADKISEEFTLRSVRVQQIRPSLGPFEEVAVDIPGAVASPSLANQTSLVVTVRTLLPGRAWRGRIYTPGLPQSSLVDGLFTLAAATNVAAAWNDLVTVTDFLGVRMLHVSQQGSPAFPDTWQYEPIAVLQGQRVPGVIRKRRIGVGI